MGKPALSAAIRWSGAAHNDTEGPVGFPGTRPRPPVEKVGGLSREAPRKSLPDWRKKSLIPPFRRKTPLRHPHFFGMEVALERDRFKLRASPVEAR